ncbi:MAG: hypothetical protein AAGH15_02985 [Myxococcota bacterium]
MMRSLISTLLISLLVAACGGGDDDVGTTDMGQPDMVGVDMRVDVDLGEQDMGGVVIPCVEDATLGEACSNNSDCDDGCACNGVEQCSAEGICQEGVDICFNENRCVTVSCDEDAEEGEECTFDLDDSECDDGLACNGAEVCNRDVGCISGTPLFCSDDDTCTIDSCDDDVGCVYTPRDLDGDGFISEACTRPDGERGLDCDDDPRFGAMINPEAEEVCDNRRDDDCDGLRDFRDDDCNPTNTDCATVQLLPGPGTYSGSTRALDDSAALTCLAGGRDAYFQFNLPEVRDLRIAISGANAAVALRAAADCASDEMDLRCVSGTSPEIFLRSVEPGDYTIVVTQTGTTDVFDLTLRFEDATTPPPLDVCAPLPDGVDISATGLFSGSFTDLVDDYTQSCATPAGNGIDAAYVFDLPPTGDFDVSLRATPMPFGSLGLSVLTDCTDTTTELGCSATFGTQNINLRDVSPGTYFVVVDNRNVSTTDFTLDVAITPTVARLPGDSCNVAIDITPPMGMMVGSGISALSGTPSPGFDGGVSCNPATNSDSYFEFTLTATQDVRVTTAAGFASHSTALMDTCGDFMSERRCSTRSGTQTQLFRSLPAGTYFIGVATTATTGSVNATIEVLPPTTPPANDVCTGATVLSVPSDTVSGIDLTGFQRDDPGCRAGTSNVEAFYEFTLATASFVSVSAVPAMGTDPEDITLTLKDSCAAATNLACEDGSAGAGPTITQVLMPGTYVVVAEAPELTPSTFDLTFAAVASGP